MASEPTEKPQTIAVIGAGPKALAIAAKATILQRLGWSVPEIMVFDRTAIASHWDGRAGYTDGLQELGTPPEKDIGFPYDSDDWGDSNAEVDQLLTQYSWHSFKISNGTYSQWIDRGRPSPTHSQWAQYLNWVAKQCAVEIRVADIARIHINGGLWELSGNSEDVLTKCEGLVITGPGEPLTIGNQPVEPTRIMDGRDFWNHLDKFTVGKYESIGIIGSGETAGTIAVALYKLLGDDCAIKVINSTGTIYSRGESYQENRRFSDPSRWEDLSQEHRREFIKRTDRGVFSLHAVDSLNRASTITATPGLVSSIEVTSDNVIAEIKYGEETQREEFDCLIVAIGFNPLTFLKTFSVEARAMLEERAGGLGRDKIERCIGTDLAVKGFAPRLHLPMLAGLEQGPGFPNLSCLGMLSDRILHPYAKPPSADV